MEFTAATTLTALWAVTSYYFWTRDRFPNRMPLGKQASGLSTPEILITYASQSGQGRELAKEYAGKLVTANRTLAERLDVRCMSQLSPADLSQYRRIFIIASTYGQGEPPDSARAFRKAMTALPPNTFSADSLQFAVLALGDSGYADFCQFGHWLHSELLRLGAQPLSPCIEVDRLNETALKDWRRLLESTLNCELSTDDDSLFFRLNDRRLLNPGSPNAGLYWIRFEAQSEVAPVHRPQPGDLVDVQLMNGERRTYSLAHAALTPGNTVVELIVRQHYRSDGTPGYGSHYLCERIDAGSQIKLTLRRGFDWSTVPAERPLILIGAGSGLAGVRAGLQARQQQQGANWLIFGERDPVYDRPCDEELVRYRELGILHRLDRVWSQSTEQQHMRYAQDVLQREADELASYLIQGGYIYVCGSAGLGEGVNDVLVELLGEPLLAMLGHQGRYIRDIY